MPDPSRQAEAGDDTGVEPSRGSPPRMPRWVKVSGIVVIVLVLVVVGLMFLIGHEGSPGPGQHGLGWQGTAQGS